MNSFWMSPVGLFIGALFLWVVGLYGGMGFYYYAAVGLIWGIVWSRMANDEDYDA